MQELYKVVNNTMPQFVCLISITSDMRNKFLLDKIAYIPLQIV